MVRWLLNGFNGLFFSSRVYVYVVELSSSPIKSRMMHIRREGAVIPREGVRNFRLV